MAKHKNYRQAASIAQDYLNEFGDWLTTNRMKVSPQKSSVTLFTSDNHERTLKPDLFLNREIISYNDNPTILRVTFDPAMSFKPHREYLPKGRIKNQYNKDSLSYQIWPNQGGSMSTI